jgi:LmbE family N-acetylglucosaminyl deacetylase
MTMNILAVVAHPDDIEIFCAGTLAKYARQGHRIFHAVFTSGNMGDLHIPPAELAATRKREAEAGAAVIGASLIWGGIDDECVYPNEPQRNRMIDILREADPDIILTHSPDDYHPDHRYVGQLVFDSYHQKGLPHIPGPTRPACRFGLTQVFYMDHPSGINFRPQEYVDITAEFETKRQMLRQHASQVASMQEHSAADIMDMLEVMARFRGLNCGCKYAEAFRREEAFHRVKPYRVLP